MTEGVDRHTPGGSPTATMRRLRALFDFERDDVRLSATLLLLAAAILSPYIRIPEPLPAVRIEQLLLAAYLYPLLRYLRRHPEARRIGPLDIAFVALPAAILVSIVAAPLIVPQVGRSFRDAFELLRPLQYWLLFRMGLTVVPTERTSRLTLLTLTGASLATGLFVLIQYLGPAAFNTAVTSLWAKGHDLDGVIRDGRVVATTTSADAFAVVAALFLLTTLWTLILRVPLPRRRAALAAAALGTGILGFVLAQSRAGSIGVVIGVVAGIVLVLVFRRPARWLVPVGLAAVYTAASIGLLMWAPSTYHTVVTRFDPSVAGSDPSVVLRIARLRLLFATPSESADTGGLCDGAAPASPSPGHEPAPDPSTPEGSAIGTRDEQRRHDVAAIAAALDRSFCATGTWPTSTDDLAQRLRPFGLTTMPTDPATRAPYPIQLDPNGYLVSSRLEDPSDPDGPDYAVTSRPNMVLNASLENGEPAPSSWQTSGGSTAVVTSEGRFGDRAADVTLAPRGYFQQFVVHTLPQGAAYSASVWLRAVDGAEQVVKFNAKEILADGSSVNNFASEVVVLPADGRWVRATARFTTPVDGLVYIVQLLMQAADPSSEARFAVDGASVTMSSVPPAFATVRDVDPVGLSTSIPSFWRSPIVGLGPLKSLLIGGDPGEYVLVLVRYGILGEIGYLLLFLAAALAGLNAWRKVRGARAALSLALVTFTIVGGVFAVTAAAYFNYQLMDIYWPVVGIVTAIARAPAEDLEAGGS